MPEGHYTTVHCRACGTDYVDSSVTEEYLAWLQAAPRKDKAKALTYEATVELDAIRNAELAEHWRLMERIRPPCSGDKMLDYGSAWGAFGAIAKAHGVVPNGIELQPAGANHSRRIWGGASTVHEGPVETAPFPPGHFAYVSSFETLEHLADPDRILAAMARLTAPDGIVAISMPSADYFGFKYWLYRRSPLAGIMRRFAAGNMQGERALIHNHIITPSVKAAEIMMERAGLEVIHREAYCSGLSGGRLGKLLKLAGRVLWTASGGRLAFAPSVLLIGRPRRPTWPRRATSPRPDQSSRRSRFAA